MTEPSCSWCGAEFAHSPPYSRTRLWKCGTWDNEEKGMKEQGIGCKTRCLKAEIERLRRELEREQARRQLLWLSTLEQEAEFIAYLMVNDAKATYCQLTGMSIEEFDAVRAGVKQAEKDVKWAFSGQGIRHDFTHPNRTKADR